MYAVWRGNVDLVNYLILAGACVHDKDRYGKTVLMYAAEKGYVDLVNVLITAGSSVQ